MFIFMLNICFRIGIRNYQMMGLIEELLKWMIFNEKYNLISNFDKSMFDLDHNVIDLG